MHCLDLLLQGENSMVHIHPIPFRKNRQRVLQPKEWFHHPSKNEELKIANFQLGSSIYVEWRRGPLISASVVVCPASILINGFTFHPCPRSFALFLAVP